MFGFGNWKTPSRKRQNRQPKNRRGLILTNSFPRRSVGTGYGRTQRAQRSASLCSLRSLRLSLFFLPVLSIGAAGDFDEMIAELRLDGTVNFPDFFLEDHSVELGNHLTGTELAEIAPSCPDGQVECFFATSAKSAPAAISAFRFSQASLVETRMCRAAGFSWPCGVLSGEIELSESYCKRMNYSRTPPARQVLRRAGGLQNRS